MSVSPNLYYAVLAMDSYNRQRTGDDPQALAVPGAIVGYAVLRTPDLQNLPGGYQDVGFFATAYDLNGEVEAHFVGRAFSGKTRASGSGEDIKHALAS